MFFHRGPGRVLASQESRRLGQVTARIGNLPLIEYLTEPAGTPSAQCIGIEACREAACWDPGRLNQRPSYGSADCRLPNQRCIGPWPGSSDAAESASRRNSNVDCANFRESVENYGFRHLA